MIKQYRWFGNDNELTTNSSEEFSNGNAFTEPLGKQIVSLGIQGLSGTKIFLSNTSLNKDIDEDYLPYLILGNTGIYQINFASANLDFVLGTLMVKIDETKEYPTGIIVDIIYKEGEITNE